MFIKGSPNEANLTEQERNNNHFYLYTGILHFELDANLKYSWNDIGLWFFTNFYQAMKR